jgi:uncharacterized membrane protein YsdA (DUF1294 family)/cold shock CspA family protein
MSERGTLVQWNDERGFGFIETHDGQRHFVHISAIARSATRPSAGDAVQFMPGLAADGRLQATRVRVLGASRGRRTDGAGLRPKGAVSIDWRYGLALLLLAGLALGVHFGRVPSFLVPAYLGMGLISFIAYGSDKHYARAGHWRTSELTLHAFDLCFGIVGGVLAQAIFRHKTSKSGFAVSTLLIALIHLAWVAAFASGFVDPAQLPVELAALLGIGG